MSGTFPSQLWHWGRSIPQSLLLAPKPGLLECTRLHLDPKPVPMGRAQPPAPLPTAPRQCLSVAVLPYSLVFLSRWGFTLTLDKQQL